MAGLCIASINVLYSAYDMTTALKEFYDLYPSDTMPAFCFSLSCVNLVLNFSVIVCLTVENRSTRRSAVIWWLAITSILFAFKLFGIESARYTNTYYRIILKIYIAISFLIMLLVYKSLTREISNQPANQKQQSTSAGTYKSVAYKQTYTNRNTSNHIAWNPHLVQVHRPNQLYLDTYALNHITMPASSTIVNVDINSDISCCNENNECNCATEEGACGDGGNNEGSYGSDDGGDNGCEIGGSYECDNGGSYGCDDGDGYECDNGGSYGCDDGGGYECDNGGSYECDNGGSYGCDDGGGDCGGGYDD